MGSDAKGMVVASSDITRSKFPSVFCGAVIDDAAVVLYYCGQLLPIILFKINYALDD